MSADHAVKLEYLVFDRACAARRLACENVKPCANRSLSNDSFKRRLIYYLSARCVDEERARSKRAQHCFVDQVARVVFERDVDAKDIAGGGYILRRLLHFDAERF